MKVALISAFAKYSVGKIMIDIANAINSIPSNEAKVFYARENCIDDKIAINVGNTMKINFNAGFARFFDNDGFCLFSSTKKIIKELEDFKPDIVHIHCLHGYYLNVKTLFEYFAKKKIKVVWTMHDAWAITGHCCYFEMAGCYKWKDHCHNCPQKNEYPKSIFLDNSKSNFTKKKKIFTSLDEDQLTIVTPSLWLKNIIEKSYLKKYSVKVINNDIDLSIFNEESTSIKLAYQKNKYMLGVASVWDKRKGLNYFLETCKTLPSDWKAIIIGRFEENISLPGNVIHINRTDNQEQLKAYYQNCAFLFNPTLDDNYPTVNIEAQACGAKVITFDSGGSLETSIGSLFVASKNDKITFDDLNEALLNGKVIKIREQKEKMANIYCDLYEELNKNESDNQKKNS